MSYVRSKCGKIILKVARALANFCDKPKHNYQEWHNGLDEINTEILRLDTARRIYSKLSDVVDKNTELQKCAKGLYFNWLIHNYCTRQGMGIRRLAERGKPENLKNLNLRNLLKQIEAAPQILCVGNYVKFFVKKNSTKPSSLWRPAPAEHFLELAHRAFSEALCEGKTVITKKEVSADLRKLWNTAKPIVDYVNEKFAHMGEFDPKNPIPIINEAHACIDLIIGIYDKYALMLGKNKFQGLPESFLTDWDKPLRIPWVK